MYKKLIYYFIIFCTLLSFISFNNITVLADSENGFNENNNIISQTESYDDSQHNGISPISAIIIWVLLAVAFLKVAQQIDTIFRSLGIGTPVGNGGGRGSLAMGAMQGIRTGESIAKILAGNIKSASDIFNNSNGGKFGDSPNISKAVPGITGSNLLLSEDSSSMDDSKTKHGNSTFQNSMQNGSNNFVKDVASQMFQGNIKDKDSPTSPVRVNGKDAQTFMKNMMGEGFNNKIVTDEATINNLENNLGHQDQSDSHMWIQTGLDTNGNPSYGHLDNLTWGNGITGEYNGKPFEILNESQFSDLSPQQQEDYSRFSLDDGTDAYFKNLDNSTDATPFIDIQNASFINDGAVDINEEASAAFINNTDSIQSTDGIAMNSDMSNDSNYINESFSPVGNNSLDNNYDSVNNMMTPNISNESNFVTEPVVQSAINELDNNQSIGNYIENGQLDQNNQNIQETVSFPESQKDTAGSELSYVGYTGQNNNSQDTVSEMSNQLSGSSPVSSGNVDSIFTPDFKNQDKDIYSSNSKNLETTFSSQSEGSMMNNESISNKSGIEDKNDSNTYSENHSSLNFANNFVGNTKFNQNGGNITESNSNNMSTDNSKNMNSEFESNPKAIKNNVGISNTEDKGIVSPNKNNSNSYFENNNSIDSANNQLTTANFNQNLNNSTESNSNMANTDNKMNMSPGFVSDFTSNSRTSNGTDNSVNLNAVNNNFHLNNSENKDLKNNEFDTTSSNMGIDATNNTSNHKTME